MLVKLIDTENGTDIKPKFKNMLKRVDLYKKPIIISPIKLFISSI